MFEQNGDQDAGSGIWNLRPLLGAIICNRILITLADRLGSGNICPTPYKFNLSLQLLWLMATREYYDFILGKRKILLSFHKSLLFDPPLFPTLYRVLLPPSSPGYHTMTWDVVETDGRVFFSEFFEQQNVAHSRNKLELREILSSICMWFLVIFYKFVMVFLWLTSICTLYSS